MICRWQWVHEHVMTRLSHFYIISNVLAFVHNKLWNPPIRLHIGHCSIRSPQFLVDQGHNIFEVRVYLLGLSGTVHCSQNIEQRHRSVNNASPGMALLTYVSRLFHYVSVCNVKVLVPYNVLRILDIRSSKLFYPIGISVWSLFWCSWCFGAVDVWGTSLSVVR